MSDNLQVQAELKLKDNLSKPASTALDAMGKAAAKTGTAVDSIGKGQSMQRTARDATDAARSMGDVARKATEVKAGLHGAEQRAAALRRVMQGVGQSAREAAIHMQRMGNGLNGVWKGGTAVAASGYAAKTTLERPVNKEQQYLYDATIAFGERKDAASIRAGVKELQALDAAAVRYGRGTNDGAMGARGALFAQGIDFDTTKQVLPGIQRTATATNSEGTDLANMVASGLKAKQFKASEVETVLGMAANAGSVGAFETKDMAKHMAGIMTNAPDMLGVKGAAYHFSNLQVMRDAAGSSDEAAMLYANLQAFRNSPEAAKNLKKKHVNLSKIYQRAAGNGDDMNVAFVDAIQKGVVEKDKVYKNLTARMATAKGADLEALQRQRATRQSTLFGQIIGDRQARQAAVALANGKDRRAEVLQAVEANPLATVNKFFDTVTASTQDKFTGLGNAWDNAMSGFFEKIKGGLDASMSGAAGFMDAHPQQSVAAAGAVAVGTTLAAGSGAAAAWDFLRKGKGAPGAGGVAGAAEGAATAAEVAPSLSKGTKSLGALKKLGKFGGPLGLLLAGADATATEMDDSLTRDQKNIEHSGTVGGLAGGFAGAAAGATVGSIVPVIGTAIGGVIGGVLGALGGSEVGKKIGGFFFGGDEAAPKGQPSPQETAAQTAQLLQQQPINATIQLNVELDGDKVAAAVEQRQLRESSRH